MGPGLKAQDTHASGWGRMGSLDTKPRYCDPQASTFWTTESQTRAFTVAAVRNHASSNYTPWVPGKWIPPLVYYTPR